MIAHDDSTREDRAAMQLAQLAQRLDGEVSAAVGASGRERMLRVLEASHARRMPRWGFALAALALVALGFGARELWIRPARIEVRVSGSALQIEGAWLGVAPDRGAGMLNFSEGTQIELGPGSKSKVAELTPRGAHVVLGAGSLRARVVHRPHASWQIGAGPYAIDVTGTAFDVDWSAPAGRLEVRLHVGSVIVRGPSLHEGVRMAAGQRLVAHAESGRAELSPLVATAPASEAVPTAAPPAPPVAAPISAPARPAPSWSDLLTSGNFRGVLAFAEARGIEGSLRRASLPDLVALSDAARYAGDGALSRRGLLAQRARFPKSPEAHAAAFVLGTMADDAGSKAEALRWYDGYLHESPHGAFAAEALGRKLVVLVSTGDGAAAESVAKLYLARFPHGAHAGYARELLQRP